jgi:hypothetical protein
MMHRCTDAQNDAQNDGSPVPVWCMNDGSSTERTRERDAPVACVIINLSRSQKFNQKGPSRRRLQHNHTASIAPIAVVNECVPHNAVTQVYVTL